MPHINRKVPPSSGYRYDLHDDANKEEKEENPESLGLNTLSLRKHTVDPQVIYDAMFGDTEKIARKGLGILSVSPDVKK